MQEYEQSLEIIFIMDENDVNLFETEEAASEIVECTLLNAVSVRKFKAASEIVECTLLNVVSV